MQFTSQLEQGDWYIMASWFCVVLALALYGLGLLINKIRHTLPRPRRQRKAADAGRPSAAPAEVAAAVGKPSHWASVIEIVEGGLAHAEATWAWHAAAAEQIDAAEYALRQLIADCARAMPTPEPVLAAPSAVPAPTVGASPEPLAA